ncbi:MAG: hypothetical protein ACFB4I_21180 [Cyanophyceae cyanobacterium]
MSSAFKLGLPTDIPWERMCVSENMLDDKICDRKAPPKWHSSIAVYKYVPAEEFQQYPNYDVTYLKVSVTITGYQPRDSEIEGQIDWDDLTTETIDELEELLNEYHPCTGAILQVAVAPKDRDIKDPERFPFIMDCEPKKREMYEMATDTKERMSRSLENLNITKSALSSQSTEILDIDMGGSFAAGGEGSYAGTGGGFNISTSTQGQWGSKQIGVNESGVVRATDNSQERRETQSFTTQISQLYHLLDSYHLGTNRIVFFMQPRPHVLEEPSGFVRGPRPIEGVQEFFVIVAKPKEQEDFCVSVRVDTAHLAERDIMDYAYRKDSLDLSVSVAPPAKDDPQAVFDGNEYIDVTGPFGGIKIGERRYKCYRKRVEQVENYIPPYSDYKIDIADSGGYQVTAQAASHGSRSVEVQPDGESLTARVWATSRKCYDDGGTPCLTCPDTRSVRSANSSLALIVNLKSKEPIRKVGTETVLLVTTRGLCCCPEGPKILGPGVIKAVPLPAVVGRKGSQFGLDLNFAERLMTTVDTTKSSEETNSHLRVQESNALTNLIRTELTAAVAPGAIQRKPPIPYIKTDFFLQKLEARLRPYEKIRHQGEQPIGHLFEQAISCNKVKEQQIEDYFHQPVSELKSRDVVRLSVDELAQVTGLDYTEAATIRLRALGIPVGEQPDTVY